MRALLPDQQQFKAIGVMLLVYYIITGAVLRPEEIPSIGAQATIWVLYVFFGGLLFFALKRSRIIESNIVVFHLDPAPLRLMLLGVLISIGSVIGFLSGLNYVLALSVWLVGILFGLYVLVQTIRSLVVR
jgi:hypothetical protein